MLDAGGRAVGMLAAVVDASWTSVAPVPQERVAAWLAAAGRVEWVDREVASAASAPAAGRTARRLGAMSPWLFGAALALAVVEALLARRFSHAVRPSGAVVRHDVPRVAAGGTSR
jgi:hypothetical protein